MQTAFLRDLPLAPRTTLGVGGSARFFATPNTPEAVQETLAAARAHDLPVFVLGGGSNLVIADAGWPGLVLHPDLTAQRGLSVGAGVNWDDFVERCVAAQLAGLECLAGIPGSVGATPIQNVGAYGQEVSEIITSVTALSRADLQLRTFSNAECRFGYRQSRFNTDELERWLILEVSFQLRPGGAPALKYRDLLLHFGPAASPTLAEVAAAVRQIRAQKGMLISAADPDSRSAGSFFKNPLVRPEQIPQEAPRFVQPDGQVKIPAAWLIERAGLLRGQRLAGGIGLSSKHVLALVNQGGGTAAQVVAAARQVQEQVHAVWGIVLHPEPIFVGFAPQDLLPEGAIRADSAAPTNSVR